MVKKISRTKCIELYSQLACIDESHISQADSFSYPQTYASYALTYQAASFTEHAGVMAQELTQMIREFGYEHCLFFPSEDKAWIQDPGERQELMDAVDFLFENNVDAGFDGGLRVSVQILDRFIKHIMMLSHYSDNFPFIYFADDSKHFLSSICSHGNIHVDVLNPDCVHLSIDAVEKSKLILIENDLCHSIYKDVHSLKNISSYSIL